MEATPKIITKVGAIIIDSVVTTCMQTNICIARSGPSLARPNLRESTMRTCVLLISFKMRTTLYLRTPPRTPEMGEIGTKLAMYVSFALTFAMALAHARDKSSNF